MTWTCQRDGACCTEPAVVVLTHAERREIERAAPRGVTLTFRPHLDRRFLQLEAHPCPLYHTSKGCTVYDVRPYACRRFACLREDYTQPYDALYPRPPLRAQRRELHMIQHRAQTWAVAHGWSEGMS